jgi:UDP-N-acetylmuramate--alanine ligase
MSAIARVLLGRGYRVSGSDRQSNATTEALVRDGATVYIGHHADHIKGATVLLISSAIQPDNPEIAAAQLTGIPIHKRSESLGAITAGYDVIGVAGTHGKTTTTALIIHLLTTLGLDPTYICGGPLLNTGQNAGVGKSKWFVIEADEYDYMFWGLAPKIGIITNVEHDHPDMFPRLEDVLAAFRGYVERIRPDGLLIACSDDPGATRLIHHAKLHNRLAIGYGMDKAGAYISDLLLTDGYNTLPSTLSGKHNLLNSFAAALVAVMAAGNKVGVGAGLASFRGTGRRMEFMGIAANGMQVYSDYGHHPTAISATLQGARTRFGDSKIWAVWQPHTYSRTHLLAGEFAACFKDADHALITDIYAARETQPAEFTSPAQIADQGRSAGHPDMRASGNLSDTTELLRREGQTGDIAIIFSAGDAPQIGVQLTGKRT